MLTITYVSHDPAQPASDLGFLLHKHPDHVHAFDLPFGRAHVIYSESSAERCTAALLIDVDPVGLVRGRKGANENFTLGQYVTERAYSASSFLSVALSRVFGTALGGRCNQKPDLPEARLALTATLAALPCRGGEGFLRALFEPLGYAVEAEGLPLDESFPDWGESPYFRVTLSAETRLQDLLTHLYVLVPVLDDDKHYFVGEAEVDKLLRHGEGWLAQHPARDAIARRYLKRQGGLVRRAMEQLVLEDVADVDEKDAANEAAEAQIEAPLSLNERRIAAVAAALKAAGAKRVLDLGCGEGRLLKELLEDRQFQEIVGVEVSSRALEIAARRLKIEGLPERQKQRLKLLNGSLTYADARFAGFDAAALVEVIEHLDLDRLASLERVVFECARPGTVVVTTPNAAYNVRFPNLPAGHVRHKDHRFEWNHEEFQRWASAVAGRFGYAVRYEPIGPVDPEVGPPTQMAVFTRGGAA
jgi:3' terminal RNA ribose 2'-O-methyltransferase Hen1